MKTIHKQEKEQFKKLFKQERIGAFEERFAVLEAFLSTERHIGAAELQELLSAAGREPTPDLVEDTLDLMCRYGFAQRHVFDNGKVVYEHRHLGQHHDHMVCTKCRRIIEFHDPRLEHIQSQVAAAHGFHLLQHRLEIYGICDACLRQRASQMSLAMAKAGEKLRITAFGGGPGARMRLMSMGLRIGDHIEVLTSPNRGQVVIAAGFKRYVIGCGLVHKILVRPAGN